MIICKRPVHLDDHLQETVEIGVVAVAVGGGGVLFRRRRKTKKELEENIWRGKPTDRAIIVQSAFSNNTIEGRDLQLEGSKPLLLVTPQVPCNQ